MPCRRSSCSARSASRPRSARRSRRAGVDGRARRRSPPAGRSARTRTDELREHLGERAVEPAALRARRGRASSATPSSSRAHRERQERLRELQELYRAAPRPRARGRARARCAREGDAGAARRRARGGDRRASARSTPTTSSACAAIARGVRGARWRPLERPAVARHARARSTRAARGRADGLRGRRRPRGGAAQPAAPVRPRPRWSRGKPVFAWSAGAMALGERIVLFHDTPPQGAGNAEVLETGLGLCRGVAAAAARAAAARLDDPRARRRSSRGASRRLVCVALDDGAAALERDGAGGRRGARRRRRAARSADGGVERARGRLRRPSDDARDPGAARRAALADAARRSTRFLAAHRFPIVEGTRRHVRLPRRRPTRCTCGTGSTACPRRSRSSASPAPTSGTSSRSSRRARASSTSSRSSARRRAPAGSATRSTRTLAHDPFGANSVCHGAGYETPEWTLPTPRRGRARSSGRASPARALRRPARGAVYLPARFAADAALPAAGRARRRSTTCASPACKTVLDNLIHRLRDPAAGRGARPSRRPAARVRRRPAPRALRRRGAGALRSRSAIPLRSGAARRAASLGASFGAVASLATAWRHPGSFGRLLLQSGSFAFTDIGAHERGPAFEPVVEFVNAFRERPAGRPSRSSSPAASTSR